MLTQKLKEFSEREADYSFLISTWWLRTMFETTKRRRGLADFCQVCCKVSLLISIWKNVHSAKTPCSHVFSTLEISHLTL